MGGDAVSSAQAGNDKVIIARIQIKLFLFLIRRSFLNTFKKIKKETYLQLIGNADDALAERPPTI